MPMRVFAAIFCVSTAFGCLAATDGQTQRAWDLERKGDPAGALELLQKDADSSSATAQSQLALVEFLERHKDPGARAACERALEKASGVDRREILRSLVILDTLADDRAALAGDLSAY
ncbi:MAG: hypothetical protein ACRD5L_00840, partial [Bryobacteraceae bacterium]